MSQQPPKKKSLMRCLGEFTGHIARGIRTKVDEPVHQEVSRTVEETKDGQVTLRRTVIEEVVYPPSESPLEEEGKSCS
ncbi:MAG: hypothetical protein MK089_05705 [Phycisphaerales bacterium]|nr:hypothetical protein [Phycisphaerales bacterium]